MGQSRLIASIKTDLVRELEYFNGNKKKKS